MPQLDLNVYVTNFSWFVIIFFISYIILVKAYMPRIYKGFFYRQMVTKYLVHMSGRDRLKFDYYTALYQFLESCLMYSLVALVLQKFKESLEFQNQTIMFDSLDFISAENCIEQTFENLDSTSFELNSGLFN